MECKVVLTVTTYYVFSTQIFEANWTHTEHLSTSSNFLAKVSRHLSGNSPTKHYTSKIINKGFNSSASRAVMGCFQLSTWIWSLAEYASTMKCYSMFMCVKQFLMLLPAMFLGDWFSVSGEVGQGKLGRLSLLCSSVVLLFYSGNVSCCFPLSLRYV